MFFIQVLTGPAQCPEKPIELRRMSPPYVYAPASRGFTGRPHKQIRIFGPNVSRT